jgi:ComF family protein
MPMRLLEAALMPRCCVFCGVPACDDERYICHACYRDLPWITDSCEFCAMPVPAPLPQGIPCPDCQAEPAVFAAAIAPLHYSFPVDSAIKALKFHRRLHYQPAFSDILLSAAAALPTDIDALVAVPLHRWRRIRRGFNQAEEIAAPLLSRLRLPRIRNVVRVVSTPYQSGLAAAERRRNLKSAFRVRGSIAAKHVLIVDDVITTGETCRQLARVLVKSGVEKVSALALARASRSL